ncbi:MAG: hypothetical protein MMC23_000397 [Stictis urceolatum]|nr:hypothetical protein [Stictis urceolata]
MSTSLQLLTGMCPTYSLEDDYDFTSLYNPTTHTIISTDIVYTAIRSTTLVNYAPSFGTQMGLFSRKLPRNPGYKLGYPHGPNPDDPFDREPRALAARDPRVIALVLEQLNRRQGGVMGARGGGRGRGRAPWNVGDDEYEYYRRGRERGLMRKRRDSGRGRSRSRDTFPDQEDEPPEHQSEPQAARRSRDANPQASAQTPFARELSQRLSRQTPDDAPLSRQMGNLSLCPSRNQQRQPTQQPYDHLRSAPRPTHQPSQPSQRQTAPAYFPPVRTPIPNPDEISCTVVRRDSIQPTWLERYNDQLQARYRNASAPYDPHVGPRPSQADMTTRHRRDRDVERMEREGGGGGRGGGRGRRGMREGEEYPGQYEIEGERTQRRTRPPGWENCPHDLSGFKW